MESTYRKIRYHFSKLNEVTNFFSFSFSSKVIYTRYSRERRTIRKLGLGLFLQLKDGIVYSGMSDLWSVSQL